MAAGWKGGERLEEYLKNAADKMASAKEVRVGFLEGSTEADGTSVPMIAAIQEWGAPSVGIPPRPFFRNMIAKHKGEWGGEVAKIMKAHDYDSNLTLSLMGERIGGELRQSIQDMNDPLSPVTLMIREMKAKDPSLRDNMSYSVVLEARRRVAAGMPYTSSGPGAKPLIDTGTMFQSVDYEVE